MSEPEKTRVFEVRLPELTEIIPDHQFAMSSDNALAFWQVVNEPPVLTPAQQELGRLMRGRR